MSACSRGPQQQKLHRRIHGGALRAAFSAPNAVLPLRSVQKVKAHQVVNSLQGAARRHAAGNDAADFLANLARERHPHGPAWQAVACNSEVAEALRVAELLAKASARWPRAHAPGAGRAQLRSTRTAEQRAGCQWAKALLRQQRRADRDATRRANLATHEWVEWGGISRCRVCLTVRTRQPGICPGAAESFRQQLVSAPLRGHRMWVAGAIPPDGLAEKRPLMACMVCGGWSLGGRSELLAAQCAPPSKHGAVAIRRLRRGVFPRAARRWEGTTVAHLMPWSECTVACSSAE